ncbi:hypothetical protein SH501x_004188 [Pirellulaceae bacterium SH501]
MVKKLVFGLASLLAMGSGSNWCYGQGPFEFQFGYSLGIQNSFRNRLPAPPYFSVFPPVYYGQRYARPYGESPFASWPLLRSDPSYHAVPMEGHLMNPRVVWNHHVPHHPAPNHQPPKVEASAEQGKSDVVSSVAPIEPKVVVNPFVVEQYVAK